jgi:GMP synthase (glutamine-hydrolysing)
VSEHDLVLVVDFGAQYAQLIARRVREAQVYSEIVPHTITAAEIKARNPKAVILSGGPASVYADGAPQIDPDFFKLDIPTFGICYGFQVMAASLGGEVAKTGLSEFGRTPLKVSHPHSELFKNLNSQLNVWMSHGDSVSKAPEDFVTTASTDGAAVAAFENLDRKLAGVQFHPEVMHSESGQRVLENFLWNIAKCNRTWTTENVVEDQVARIKAQIGENKVICGLSGGVDSAVAAALVHKAVGDQLTCVFVDHGLLREGEREQVEHDYVAATGIRLVVVDAREKFLSELAGISDPETKRKTIGRLFIRVFEEAERALVAESKGDAPIKFLVQGTLIQTLLNLVAEVAQL